MTLDPIRGLERLLRWGCRRPSLTFAKGKCPTIERYCLTQEPFFRERFLFPSAAIVSLAWSPSWQIPDQKTPAGGETPVPSGDRRKLHPRKGKVFGLPLQGKSLIKKHPRAAELPSPQATGGSPTPAKKKSLACPYRANPRSKNTRGQQNSRPLRRPEGAPSPRRKSLWPTFLQKGREGGAPWHPCLK